AVEAADDRLLRDLADLGRFSGGEYRLHAASLHPSERLRSRVAPQGSSEPRAAREGLFATSRPCEPGNHTEDLNRASRRSLPHPADSSPRPSGLPQVRVTGHSARPVEVTESLSV